MTKSTWLLNQSLSMRVVYECQPAVPTFIGARSPPLKTVTYVLTSYLIVQFFASRTDGREVRPFYCLEW